MRALLLLFLLVALTICGEYDFTVEVPPGKFQCYFQAVTDSKYKSIEVDYQVIDGGDLNINFMVLLGAEVLVQENMKTDGSHKIEVKQPGDYQFCFDNAFSYQARKVVFFEIFLYDAAGNLDDFDYARAGLQDANLKKRMEDLGVTVEVFQSSATRIKNNFNKVEYHQAVLRAHEARDRAIMNANLDRVTFWSILNALVLMFVAGIQVYMIRSLFEENSKIGQFLRKGTHQD
ncbi:unnamed protein product, partial [Mesorhabditis belari]|uniref:GOLD domain-containing protein n=1 Tax=Mesorhabditis belari TaxID=2138241 RepID=A0AAF3J1Z1_9BILA